MQAFKTAILVASVAALAGCASWQKDSSVASSGYDTSPICSKTHGWQPWPDSRCNPPEAAKEPGPDLAAELAAAQKQNSALSRRASDLERQVADSNREIATLQSSNSGLKGQLAASMALAAGLGQGTKINSQPTLPRPGNGMSNLRGSWLIVTRNSPVCAANSLPRW